ncbi:MAG: 50S ribosomal protein L29 [Nanoarchaeota archaeon]
MKKIELKQLSKDQLKEKLVELRRDLMRLNTQRSTKTIPENPSQIKNLRKNIARILTFMKQKTTMEVKSNKK